MKKLFTLFVLSSLLFSTVTPSFAEEPTQAAEPTQPIQPTIEISGVADGGVYNTGVTPIITGSSYKATLDGWRTFTSGTVIDSEGSHTLKVVSLDGSISKVLTFQIDKTVPTFSTNLDDLRDQYRYNPNVSLTNYDSSSVTLYYTINGVTNTVNLERYGTYKFTEISADGTYAVSVYTIDLAGNKSKTVEKTFTIDSTGPDIQVSGVEEGGVYRSVSPIFSVSEGTVSARLDYWDKIESGTAITKEGSHTLTLEAKDSAGNSTTKNVKFTIDAKGPKLQGRSSGWYDDSYILDASSFSVTSPIELLFNEEVNVNTITSSSISLRNVDTGQVESLDFSRVTQQKQASGSYYENGKYLVSIPVKEKLKGSSNYKLTIVSSAITDRVGNSMDEKDNVVIDMKTRLFYGAPEVASTNIDREKINGAEPIALEFKEPLEEDKVDTSHISLTNVNNGSREDFTVNVSENTLTITPNMGLKEDTEYKLTLDADSVRSLDSVPMQTNVIKSFKTADLFKVISGPETSINEKRPGLDITFSNPIDESYVSDEYFSLMESGNTNRNDAVEASISLSNDKKTVTVVPDERLQSGGQYTLTVSDSIQDIYKHSLASKENVSFTFEIGNIETNINQASSLTYKIINFKTIELSFTDRSQGEEGYSIEIDGDKLNSYDIPSVKGVYSTFTKRIVFDEKLTRAHSINVIPIVDEGEEDYSNAVSLDNIKLKTNKPVKPIEVRAKLLKDGTLEWSWKDVPSDYEGEASYVIIRKSIREKASSKNRTRSSNGTFKEKINLDNEKIVNNTITRYISRSVNVDGTVGADYESDKVAFKIKLPAAPPRAILDNSEFELNSSQFSFKWHMNSSKNVVRQYRYVVKRNKEVYWTSEEYSISSGKNSYSDSFESYYSSLNEDDTWQVVVETFNSVGVKTSSTAKTITFTNN